MVDKKSKEDKKTYRLSEVWCSILVYNPAPFQLFEAFITPPFMCHALNEPLPVRLTQVVGITKDAKYNLGDYGKTSKHLTLQVLSLS